MHIDHFKEHFQTIIDQRQGAKITYCLFEVLFGSLCAVIAGAKGWFDIREYIRGHHDWFKRNNLFLNGIPADDTIARIISTIEPEQLHECFVNWMSSIHTLTDGQVIAIDGKTLRGSYNREDRTSTIHMISAYASSNKLVLGQLKTEQKSNEITAIPELIKMLDIKGALVTIDAMAVREHWGIESMHWVLDVTMNEDACQIYKDHGAENLSCLRHMSLNMLREEPTKLSIVGKQKRCMINTSMLEAVLSAGFSQMAKN